MASPLIVCAELDKASLTLLDSASSTLCISCEEACMRLSLREAWDFTENAVSKNIKGITTI
jgi:hypothetical protein